MIDAIIDALSRGSQWLVNLVVKIINGLINFARDVLQWFRSLNLKPTRHNPFICNLKVPGIKQAIKEAKVVNAGVFDNENTIVEGVYDNTDDSISNIRIISGDGFDEKTKSILEDDDLVVLR